MASTHPASAPGSQSPANRVPPEPSIPARVTAEPQRRSPAERRTPPPASRHDAGDRSGDGAATNGRVEGRGPRRDDPRRGLSSHQDGENGESKLDRDNRASMLSDEFALISVPLDTWVGRYVRITTPRHNGTTGLVHRTGNGWVNLQTANGEVAKRAYDLVVIPEERASIGSGSAGLDKGDSRGKRNRSTKDPSNIGSTSGSGDDRKASASRARNTRMSVMTAHSSSDSSGQDEDNEEDGDEHDNGRPARRRSRAALDGSEFDDGDDDEDDDAHDNRYDDDGRMRTAARGGKPFAASKPGRSVARGGGRDRFGGGEFEKEAGKSSGRMSVKYGGGRETGTDKGRGRSKGDQDKIRERERERGRGGGDHPRALAGKERDSMRGDGFGKGRERDPDAGASRPKRKDPTGSLGLPGDSDDKLLSGGASRDRVDRSKEKPTIPVTGKKDEAVKSSWLTQMSKAKERPNLVRWREELVAITKDSSEDFEDATLSVELMRVRCDVCYHEKADGDKFCWNEQCWLSPIYIGYFKSDLYASGGSIVDSSGQRVGYVNTFGRETVIDSSLTSALQAPVKWLETKRKRKLEAHEVFSEDPALYRWQCWASTFKNPNSKDPTFVDQRVSDVTRSKSSAAGNARGAPGLNQFLEGRRSGGRGNDNGGISWERPNGDDRSGVDEADRAMKPGKVKPSVRNTQPSAPDVLKGMGVASSPRSGYFAPSRSGGAVDGSRGHHPGEDIPFSRKNALDHASEEEPRGGGYMNEDRLSIGSNAEADNVQMHDDGRHVAGRRGDRLWA